MCGGFGFVKKKLEPYFKGVFYKWRYSVYYTILIW